AQRVHPALGEQATGVVADEQVLRPFLVGQRARVLGVGHVGLAAVVELDLFARPAVGAGDELHLKAPPGQWATRAAPCSSITAPVTEPWSAIRGPGTNRSRLYGAMYGCGSPVASISARHHPAPGVPLNPPVPH